MPVNGPIFEATSALPRGPHDLTRDEVRDSQVARLGAATAALVAEVGYPEVTIGAIATRAGVSRATFYEHYRNKEACYLDAYAHFGAVLTDRLAATVQAGPEGGHTWEEFVDALLASYLGMLDGDRAAARAFVLEIDGAGPTARADGRALYARMATFVRDQHESIRRADRTLGPLPPEAYAALVHGIRGLVRDALDTHPDRPLVDLAPSLRSWIGAIIRGARPSNEDPPMLGT